MFTGVGYAWVPSTIVAVVIVMERIEGCSDREAACRFRNDARCWTASCGP
jgi:hypothetical protein